MKYINHVRQNQVYSGIENLPKGTAPDTIIEGCAVLEGGRVSRGLWRGRAGAMMEQGLNLSCTIGVSAGALNGLNYVAGNIGRAARTNLRFRHDDRYVGLTALRHNHGLIGFDFAFHELNRYEPLNLERLHDPRRRFVAVATDCRTASRCTLRRGNARIFLKRCRPRRPCRTFRRWWSWRAENVWTAAALAAFLMNGRCMRATKRSWSSAQGRRRIVRRIRRPGGAEALPGLSESGR